MNAFGPVSIGLVIAGPDPFPAGEEDEGIKLLSHDLGLLVRRLCRAEAVINTLQLVSPPQDYDHLNGLCNNVRSVIFFGQEHESSKEVLNALFHDWFPVVNLRMPLFLLQKHPVDDSLEARGMFRRIYSFADSEARRGPKKNLHTRTFQFYWDRLTNLVLDIRQSISGSHGVSLPEKKNVLVTDGGAGFYRQRQNLVYELESLGLSVLPERPLPHEPGLLKQSLTELLKKSELVIEIIGDVGNDARLPDQTSVSRVQLSLIAGYNNALPASEKPVPRLLWIPPGTAKISDEQQALQELLFRGGELLTGAEIIQAPLEHLKKIVRKKITPAVAHSNKTDTDPEPRNVYVLSEHGFVKEGEKLCEQLKNMGMNPVPSWELFQGENIISRHYHHLVNSRGVLIFYPGNRSWWLKSIFHDIMKAPGFTGRHSGRIVSVYHPGPVEDSFRDNPGVLFLEGDASFTAGSLQPFIEKMNT